MFNQVQGTQVFINNRPHGEVKSNNFVTFPSLVDLAASFLNLTTNSLSQWTPDSSNQSLPPTTSNQVSYTTTNIPDWLSVLYLNSRSLANKIASFQTMVYSTKPSFVAVTKTWLYGHIYNNEILLSGYCIFGQIDLLVEVVYLLPLLPTCMYVSFTHKLTLILSLSNF